MNEEDILLEQRNAHMSAIRLSFKEEGFAPSSLWDLDAFMMYFFCSSKRRPLCFTAIPGPEVTLGVSYEYEGYVMSGVIKFFGDGQWSYEFEIDLPCKAFFTAIKDVNRIKIFFEGKAMRVRKDGLDKQSNYAFMLEERIDKLLVIKEVFKHMPEKIFSVNKGIEKHHDYISAGWATSFYDGPLAGFCYLHNQLHYYALSEELEYSRERLSLVYPLTLHDKFYAYLNHFIFTQYLKGRKKTYQFLKFIMKKDIKYNKLTAIGAIKH